MTPMPALLTSASIEPAASIAAAMLAGLVTSSARTRSRSDRGRMSSRGVRMVAITFQPCAWKWRAVSRPYPEEHPVISTVFMTTPFAGSASVDQPIVLRLMMTATTWTFYNVESTLHWRSSSNDRPTFRSHHIAAAACGVLEADQRRRTLGRPLLCLRPAQLLRRAGRQLSSGGRWPRPADTRGRRFRSAGSDAGLFDVGFRAG